VTSSVFKALLCSLFQTWRRKMPSLTGASDELL